MAQIRIVDDWRRSPGSGPSHYRSVMVIAEKWAEQRVLMRAYAESRDRLRPTIVLQGTELAIGPAGLDLQGPWGIHVGDDPEVRAPYIKDQLEISARQRSGGKANAPRVAPAPPAVLAPTALGYASGSGAQSAIVRLGLLPHISARLGRLVDRVVPDDFHIDGRERRVLNALGEGQLTAGGVGQMLDLPDPVAFMDALTRKLARYHLDLVEIGALHGREPTYRLRC